MIAEISPIAAEHIEFYGRRLAVGDRISMCPDVVCGRCYPGRSDFSTLPRPT